MCKITTLHVGQCMLFRVADLRVSCGHNGHTYVTSGQSELSGRGPYFFDLSPHSNFSADSVFR